MMEASFLLSLSILLLLLFISVFRVKWSNHQMKTAGDIKDLPPGIYKKHGSKYNANGDKRYEWISNYKDSKKTLLFVGDASLGEGTYFQIHGSIQELYACRK